MRDVGKAVVMVEELAASKVDEMVAMELRMARWKGLTVQKMIELMVDKMVDNWVVISADLMGNL